MFPKTGQGLTSYFEEKRPYDEEDIRAVVEFLAKKRTMEEQDPERAHTETKQPVSEETQDSLSVPNAELRAISKLFEASKLSNSQNDSKKESPKGKK
ncbi:hypothetical protein N7G274_003897 [Stereocaulon virgatum]|uniref:Uncharacterized protein n=1 Tax=Stereocaulon virgatum TaxID=373712 RepID=A0ABR4AEQ3_9LECA